jgi:PAS domain S-box-containing protein
MVVTPVEGIHSEDNFYVIFFQTEEKENLNGVIIDDESQDESVSKLKSDLETTKAHLQNVIEELETSYEETQSLNEELQSSNEELQSSNEELETTNEELQSTNEELQTAYAELKMLYNEKDDKNKRLEDLAEKLKQNSQNLRDQKDLTEAIINSVPVAITMVDENGMISFANENALKLYRLSKNEIQSKSFDANVWNITTYDDKPFPREKLPFMLVKKTFDKVFDIEHAVTIDGNKLYLSVSGAPLFDSEGRFKGAVFSVVDTTKNIIAMHNIESYQKSLEENNELVEAIRSGKNISFGSSFEIFQQLIGTLSIRWRNDLNKLSLYLDSFKEKNLSKLELESINALEKIENIQSHLTQELNNLHSFFISSLMNQNLSNIQILKETLKIFEESFDESNIQIIDELQYEDEVLVQTHKIKSSYFLIMEFLLHVKKLSNSSSKDTLLLTSQKKKLIFSLNCCINEVQDQANIQNLKNEFESLFNTEIKISCIDKKLIVELSF